jgi:NAD(P)H-hydrate repair Nnr-like enzyme with NAD(P)H-hydrate dehydratase domain
MADIEALKLRVQELAERQWDVPALEARIKRLTEEGIRPKTLSRDEILANKPQILDRVQLRAEEYNFILKNCAQGTALALLEEFGMGSMEIIKALTPFPGIGGTGETCGGITGSLIAFGLFFGSDDRLDAEAIGSTINQAQKFMAFFEDAVGRQLCAEAFAEAKGFEKCGLATGIGARLAAELMLDRMV